MRNGVWKIECEGVYVGEITDAEYQGMLKQVKKNLMLYPFQIAHSVYVTFKLFLECIPMSTMFCVLLAGLYASLHGAQFNEYFGEDPARLFAIVFQVSFAAGLLSTVTAPLFYGFLGVGYRNIKAEQLHLAIRRHISLAASGALKLSFTASTETLDKPIESEASA